MRLASRTSSSTPEKSAGAASGSGSANDAPSSNASGEGRANEFRSEQGDEQPILHRQPFAIATPAWHHSMVNADDAPPSIFDPSIRERWTP